MTSKIFRGTLSGDVYVVQSSEQQNDCTVVPDACGFPLAEAQALCEAAVALRRAKDGGGYRRAGIALEVATDAYIEAVDRIKAPVSLKTNEPQEKDYEVWREGYAATGESGNARYVGAYRARSFKEACAKAYAGKGVYDATRNTYWGCRLFDNEADARKNFG